MTYLCLITKQTLPGRVPENISLEKIKLMAKVATQGGADEETVDSKLVQQKLSELTQLASKLTQRQMQILSELKKSDFTSCPPKRQKGMNRMHPYDNSNRARPPRGRGLGRGQCNSRPSPQEGFGQMVDNRSRALAVWNNTREPWGSNQGPPQGDPTQLEPWPRGQNQRNSWGPGPQPNQHEPWPGPNQRGPWGPDQNTPWNSDPSASGNWASNHDPDLPVQRRMEFGQGIGLEPIPTSLGFPSQRLQQQHQQHQHQQQQQQQLPPDVGRRLNFAPIKAATTDAHFINPMFRHLLSDGEGGQGGPLGPGLDGQTGFNNSELLIENSPFQRLGGFGEPGQGSQDGPGSFMSRGGFGNSGSGPREGPRSCINRDGFGAQGGPDGPGYFMQGRQDDYGSYGPQGGPVALRGRGNYGGNGSFSDRSPFSGDCGPGGSGSFEGQGGFGNFRGRGSYGGPESFSNRSSFSGEGGPGLFGGNSSFPAVRSFADDEDNYSFGSQENPFGRTQRPRNPSFDDPNAFRFNTIDELQRAQQQQQQFGPPRGGGWS